MTTIEETSFGTTEKGEEVRQFFQELLTLRWCGWIYTVQKRYFLEEHILNRVKKLLVFYLRCVKLRRWVVEQAFNLSARNN